MSGRIKDILRNDAYFNTDPADPRNREERSYLVEIRNRHLRPLTQDQFPKPGFRTPDNEEGRHPIFLLARNGNWGNTFCPCSSSVGDNVTGNALTCSHIKKDIPVFR